MERSNQILFYYQHIIIVNQSIITIPFFITSIYAITIPFKQKFYMPK